MAGSFAVARELFTEPDAFWQPEGPWSKREAWLDVLASAAWEDDHGLKRGEVWISSRKRERRWRWSRNRVRRFLRDLEKRKTLKPKGGFADPVRGSIYLVVNYGRYAFGGPGSRTRQRTQTKPKKTNASTELVTTDKMNPGDILKAWLNTLPEEISAADRAKQMVAARRIAKTRTAEQIMKAMVGMTLLWETHKGRPWDLWDLDKKFVIALQKSSDHPQVRESRIQQQWEEERRASGHT